MNDQYKWAGNKIKRYRYQDFFHNAFFLMPPTHPSPQQAYKAEPVYFPAHCDPGTGKGPCTAPSPHYNARQNPYLPAFESCLIPEQADLE